jgi:uncharacterized protein (UPF0332 family)
MNFYSGNYRERPNFRLRRKLDQILFRCFNPRKGYRPELLKTIPRINKAEAHLDKAHRNLKAMNLMFENEFFDWTVICGYYAIYHAVLAALFQIGLRAFSHLCAVTAFQKFFIEREKVPIEYSQFLKRAGFLEKRYSDTLFEARENRVKVQYGTEILANDDAEWIIEDAEDFVLKIEELLAA